MPPDPLTQVAPWLPLEATQIILVLFLSSLVGMEREEHRTEPSRYTFGGVRTFPLIALVGYAVSLLSGPQMLPLAVGFAVVGSFLLMSYRHKLEKPEAAGVTSEVAGLATFLVGALVQRGFTWIAITLGVTSVLLLELKQGLEGLSRKLPPMEVLNFTKFLLVTLVILPMLPNHGYGPMQLNPFKVWLVVVAVSGVSYGSYLLQKATRGRGGAMVPAVLGGAYSSTVTTVVLARRSVKEQRPHQVSGATLVASGMMYLRLLALMAIFNQGICRQLMPWLLGLGLGAILVGAIWSRQPDPAPAEAAQGEADEPRNPLELRSAFLFAAIFVVCMVATHLTIRYMGRTGLLALAGIMGITDVDPFIMGLAQSTHAAAQVGTASAAVLVAAAANNLVKGIYAFSLSERRTGIQSLVALAALAAAGILPLVLMSGSL